MNETEAYTVAKQHLEAQTPYLTLTDRQAIRTIVLYVELLQRHQVVGHNAFRCLAALANQQPDGTLLVPAEALAALTDKSSLAIERSPEGETVRVTRPEAIDQSRLGKHGQVLAFNDPVKVDDD